MNKNDNFDNALRAMLSLFIMSTASGWIQIMNSAVDAVGIGEQPKFENAMGC